MFQSWAGGPCSEALRGTGRWIIGAFTVIGTRPDGGPLEGTVEGVLGGGRAGRLEPSETRWYLDVLRFLLSAWSTFAARLTPRVLTSLPRSEVSIEEGRWSRSSSRFCVVLGREGPTPR